MHQAVHLYALSQGSVVETQAWKGHDHDLNSADGGQRHIKTILQWVSASWFLDQAVFGKE